MNHDTPESRIARVLDTDPGYMAWGGNPPDGESLLAWLRTKERGRHWKAACRDLMTHTATWRADPDLVFAAAVNEAYHATLYRSGHDVIGPAVEASRARLEDQKVALAAVRDLRGYFGQPGITPMRWTVGPFGMEHGGRGSVIDQLDCIEQSVLLSARDVGRTMAQAGPFVFLDNFYYDNKTNTERFATNGLICRLASLFHWAAAGPLDDVAWGHCPLKDIELGRDGRGPLIEALLQATFPDFEPAADDPGKRVRQELNRKKHRDARLTRWPVNVSHSSPDAAP